jgi:hypothetical protein
MYLCLLLALAVRLAAWCLRRLQLLPHTRCGYPPPFARRPQACQTTASVAAHRRKPDWLRHEVLRLKAHMPRAGCRAVARTFNRLHPSVSVGKTFVADLIASHQHEIAELRRQIRAAQPRTVAVNHTWAMDMTFFTVSVRSSHLDFRLTRSCSRYVST